MRAVDIDQKRELRSLNQEKCEGCQIVTGGIEDNLIEYRGHRVCFHCVAEWDKREKRKGREISWEEFTKPPFVKTVSQAKLRDEQIREQAEKGGTIKELSVSFGVGERTIERALEVKRR